MSKPKYTVTLLHRFPHGKNDRKTKFDLMWWKDQKQYIEHDIASMASFAYREVTNPWGLADEDFAIVISVRQRSALDKSPRDPDIYGTVFGRLCEVFRANRVINRQAEALDAEKQEAEKQKVGAK